MFFSDLFFSDLVAEKHMVATDEKEKTAVRECIDKPFVPFVPEALKRYL